MPFIERPPMIAPVPQSVLNAIQSLHDTADHAKRPEEYSGVHAHHERRVHQRILHKRQAEHLLTAVQRQLYPSHQGDIGGVLKDSVTIDRQHDESLSAVGSDAWDGIAHAQEALQGVGGLLSDFGADDGLQGIIEASSMVSTPGEAVEVLKGAAIYVSDTIDAQIPGFLATIKEKRDVRGISELKPDSFEKAGLGDHVREFQANFMHEDGTYDKAGFRRGVAGLHGIVESVSEAVDRYGSQEEDLQQAIRDIAEKAEDSGVLAGAGALSLVAVGLYAGIKNRKAARVALASLILATTLGSCNILGNTSVPEQSFTPPAITATVEPSRTPVPSPTPVESLGAQPPVGSGDQMAAFVPALAPLFTDQNVPRREVRLTGGDREALAGDYLYVVDGGDLVSIIYDTSAGPVCAVPELEQMLDKYRREDPNNRGQILPNPIVGTQDGVVLYGVNGETTYQVPLVVPLPPDMPEGAQCVLAVENTAAARLWILVMSQGQVIERIQAAFDGSSNVSISMDHGLPVLVVDGQTVAWEKVASTVGTATPILLPTLTLTPTETPLIPTERPTVTATPEKTSCADLDYARSFSEEKVREAGLGSLNEAVTKWVQDDAELKGKFDKARGDELIGLLGVAGTEESSLLDPIGFYIGSFEINVPAGQMSWGYAYDGFSGMCLVHAVPYKKDGKLEVMALPLIVSAHGISVNFDTYVFEQGVGLLKLSDLRTGDKFNYNYLIYQSKKEAQLQMKGDSNPGIFTKFIPFNSLIGAYTDYLFNPQHRQELLGFSDSFPSTLDQYLAVFTALNGGRVAPFGWPVWRLGRYK